MDCAGTVVERRADEYRKYESAHQNVAHYLSVLKETEGRRRALLQGIKDTSEAITSAKNIAEVSKLQGVAATQIAALSAIDGERAAALGSVMARSLANDTDTALQEKARTESRSIEMQFATKNFSFVDPCRESYPASHLCVKYITPDRFRGRVSHCPRPLFGTR